MSRIALCVLFFFLVVFAVACSTPASAQEKVNVGEVILVVSVCSGKAHRAIMAETKFDAMGRVFRREIKADECTVFRGPQPFTVLEIEPPIVVESETATGLRVGPDLYTVQFTPLVHA